MPAVLKTRSDQEQAKPYYHLVIAAMICMFPVPTFAVTDLSLTLGRIEFQNLIASEVSIAADLGTGESVDFIISAASLSLSDSLLIEQVEISCADGRLSAMVLSCMQGTYRGALKDHGEINGQLAISYHLASHAVQLTLPTLAIGAGTITASLTYAAGNWTVDLQASDLGLLSLRKIADVFTLWPPEYSGESGTLDFNLKVAGSRDGLQSLQGTLHLDTVGFYGSNAAEALSGEVSFDVQSQQGWDISTDGSITGGAVFIDSRISVGNIRPGIAIEISELPLRFAIDLRLDPLQQQINVQQLDIDHPGVMTAQLQADAGRIPELTIHQMTVDLSVHDAGEFYTTYLQPFLLDTQFNNLKMSGAFATEARIDPTGLTHLDLQFNDVHAEDSSGRFNIAGLEGAFKVTDAVTPVVSSLTWDNAGLYRLLIGTGKLVLESSEQTVNIVSWDDVPVLDGQLQINSLSIINPGEADMAVELDGALTPVSMTDFTTVMGWPVMSGELTAAIDGLTYSQGTLVVDGQINLGLFDGNVYIRNLRIQDLFGLVPELYADIDIDMLDLELLTNRFTFGQIQGHLSGKVHKLELQAWEPVYFEAELATPENDPTRHRISQKAVENLGYIGGGAGGALSGGFLRIFKNYSYGRMGLSCRLYNGSCEMGGVDTTADGFIIVSRGGLIPPWIEVKGTGHSIDWMTLINGIKSITTNKPEFE